MKTFPRPADRFYRLPLFMLLLCAAAFFLFACGSDENSDPDNSDGDSDTAEAEPESEADGDGDGELAPEEEAEAQADGDEEAEVEDETEVESADPLWGNWEEQGAAVGEMLGIATHMYQCEGENENRDFEFARYDELGGLVMRQHMRWDDLEPADDEWHFEKVADQVALAVEHGVRFVPQVGYDVKWAETGEGDSTLIPEEYGEFTGRVATEYCDVIKDYELWNEPDMSVFWEPKPDPQHYGLLVKQAYAAIKAACPDARVSLGGMASYSDVDLFNRWWFLRGLYEAHPDIADYFDAVAVHPYTFMVSYPPENDYIREGGESNTESQSRMTEMLREILSEMGKPDAPIWYTEVGWPTYGVDEEVIARWLARSALLASRDGVEFWLWYTFFDSEPEPDDPTDNWSNFFGLFGWPGDTNEPRRTKPAWYALKGLSDMLRDAHLARDLSPLLELPNDVYVLGFVRADGVRVLAAWDGREKPDKIDGETFEGGEDTTYDLTLPLPPEAQAVKIYDQRGEEISSESAFSDAPVPTLTLTLDTSVRYVVVEE